VKIFIFGALFRSKSGLTQSSSLSLHHTTRDDRRLFVSFFPSCRPLLAYAATYRAVSSDACSVSLGGEEKYFYTPKSRIVAYKNEIEEERKKKKSGQ
jgi:hypothetical protein